MRESPSLRNLASGASHTREAVAARPYPVMQPPPSWFSVVARRMPHAQVAFTFSISRHLYKPPRGPPHDYLSRYIRNY